MGDETLRAALEQVQAELAAARTRHAILGAEIAGLEARETALIKAMQASDGDAAGPNHAGGHRTDEIVEVLASCGLDMSIKEVIVALGRAGRPNDTYDNVSADLAYLAQGRVRVLTAARLWRTARPRSARPGGLRKWRSGQVPGRGAGRIAGRSAGRPARTGAVRRAGLRRSRARPRLDPTRGRAARRPGQR